MKTFNLFQIHQIKTQPDFDVPHQKDTFTLPAIQVPGWPGMLMLGGLMVHDGPVSAQILQQVLIYSTI